MKRNDFLKNALAGTAALFAVNWGTLAEIRAYKQPDKPLLTEANLNRLFTKWGEESNETPLREAITDTKAFLDKYFSISPQQKETMSRMKEEDWKNIQSIIGDVRAQKGTVNFKFVNKGEQCLTELRLLKKESREVIQPKQTVPAKQIPQVNKPVELRKIIVQ